MTRLSIFTWLVVTLVAATGCSSKPPTPEQQAQADLAAYDAQIRNVAGDPARADKLVALTDEFDKLGWQSIASVNEYRGKVAALNAGPALPAEISTDGKRVGEGVSRCSQVLG